MSQLMMTNQLKKIFDKVITDGNGLNLDFENSVVDINREKKISKWKLQEKKPEFLY